MVLISTFTCYNSYDPYQSPITSYYYSTFKDEANETRRNYING